MKAIRLGLGCAALMLASLSLLGCQEDNEQAAALTGVAPTGVNGQPAPKSQAEYYKQQQEKNTYNQNKYPGAGGQGQ